MNKIQKQVKAIV